MLKISVLVKPCKDLYLFKSLGLVTITSEPSTLISKSSTNLRVKVPLGPLTVITLPSSSLTSTPAGIATGNLPIRDIQFTSFYYHTKAITSPPTPSFLASLSVITPLLVETIAVPIPPKTLGNSSLLA